MGENWKAIRRADLLRPMSNCFVVFLSFQLDVHIRDECPATAVQCEYKNLGCEAVVRTSFYILDGNAE